MKDAASTPRQESLVQALLGLVAKGMGLPVPKLIQELPGF